jgi:hypothetical protein
MTEEQTDKDKLDELDALYEKKYSDIKKDIDELFKIDEYEIGGESIKHISKMHFYNSRLTEEKMMLFKIKRKLDEIHGEMYEKYRFNNSFKLSTKGEVEEWINRDPKWQRILSRYEYQSIIVDHYKRIVDSLRDKGFMIKNLIDLKKIELGLR